MSFVICHWSVVLGQLSLVGPLPMNSPLRRPNKCLNVMRIVDTKPVTLGETSSCAPTLSVAGGLLYIGWVGSDLNNVLNVLSSADTIHFGSKAEIQETTIAGLSMVAFAKS